MVQAIRRRIVTSDTQVQFQVRQRRINCGLNGTGTCFAPSTLGFSRSYLSTNAPYSFILRGWSQKSSASTIDGNSIGKIFFLSSYICHKHPCENASHSIT